MECDGYADVDPAVWKMEHKSHGREKNVVSTGK
jgi:hypothetical protein